MSRRDLNIPQLGKKLSDLWCASHLAHRPCESISSEVSQAECCQTDLEGPGIRAQGRRNMGAKEARRSGLRFMLRGKTP